MANVYIVGTGMTPFGRAPEKSVAQLAGEAIAHARAEGWGLV